MSSVHSCLLHRSSAGSMRAPHSTRMPFACAISWLLLVMMKPPTSCFWRCRNPCGWKLTRRPLGDSSCVLWPGMRGSVEAHCCPDDTGYNHLCLLAEQGHGWKSIFTFMARKSCCGETGIPAHTLCLDPPTLCVCVLMQYCLFLVLGMESVGRNNVIWENFSVHAVYYCQNH